MNYIFASDSHGTGEEWIRLVNQAITKYPKAKIVFGGDYIDGRKQVIKTLEYVEYQRVNKQAIVLRGNHEQMLLDYAEGKDKYNLWLDNGGANTISQIKDIKKYYSQIKKMPLIYETENIIFVHAGVNPSGYPTDDEYKLWARERYWYGISTFDTNTPFAHNKTGKTIVTGHTPTCLIKGLLLDLHPSDIPNEITGDVLNFNCPVLKIQYNNEPARIFTDGGCHSDLSNHNGNVVVLNDKGNIIDVFH